METGREDGVLIPSSAAAGEASYSSDPVGYLTVVVPLFLSSFWFHKN
jgi:hypothetical protein